MPTGSYGRPFQVAPTVFPGKRVFSSNLSSSEFLMTRRTSRSALVYALPETFHQRLPGLTSVFFEFRGVKVLQLLVPTEMRRKLLGDPLESSPFHVTARNLAQMFWAKPDLLPWELSELQVLAHGGLQIGSPHLFGLGLWPHGQPFCLLPFLEACVTLFFLPPDNNATGFLVDETQLFIVSLTLSIRS